MCLSAMQCPVDHLPIHVLAAFGWCICLRLDLRGDEVLSSHQVLVHVEVSIEVTFILLKSHVCVAVLSPPRASAWCSASIRTLPYQ